MPGEFLDVGLVGCWQRPLNAWLTQVTKIVILRAMEWLDCVEDLAGVPRMGESAKIRQECHEGQRARVL